MSNEKSQTLPSTFYKHIMFNVGLKNQWSINLPFVCNQCGHCCTLYMMATAGRLTGKPSEDQMLGLSHELHLYKVENRGKDWKKTPCPFLENNLCTIYECRPEGCKSFPCSDFGADFKECEPLARHIKFQLELEKNENNYTSRPCDTIGIYGEAQNIEIVKLSKAHYKSSLQKLRAAGMTADEEFLFRILNGKDPKTLEAMLSSEKAKQSSQKFSEE